jgi:DNA-binding response OmpR family regulator
MPKTLLIVDDEERLRALLRDYMEHEGYRVLLASDGQEALRVARQERPDLIILDLMMPGMDGWDFMRRHQPEHRTPLIILTARLDDTDKVLGLELGADDYVTKPFSPRVLAARVRAVLRRAGAQPPEAEVLRVSDLVLNRAAHRVTARGEAVALTPSEFDLLATLMSAPGRVFTRLDLLERVQGTLYEGYERTIDVHVRNLRAKIEPDPRRPRYVETVYGVGYRLAAE